MNINIDIEKVIEVIKAAGGIINRKFQTKRSIESKGKSNYVTDLDKEIEQYIIEKISQLYPQYPFISEESQHNLGQVNTYWVLDPIDGTTNLIHNYPRVCISIALISCNETIFGIVYSPLTNELFYAQQHKGAYIQKGDLTNKISVSGCNNVEYSLIGFGCPYNKERIPLLFDFMKLLLSQCDDIKRTGPASLDLCYVACGILDAYLELDLEIWDFLAGSLILKEAGGIITDINGNLVENKKSDILVSNGKIHTKIIDIIKNSR